MTRLALSKDRITLTFIALIVFAGLYAYFTLPQAEDPGFTVRVAMVTTRFPGAGPQRVESLVTDEIERKVQELPELDFVSSESRAGISIVRVNIKQQYADMDPIWDDLRRKIDQVRDELPDGVVGPVVDTELADTFGILIGLTGEGFSDAELEDVAKEVRDELLLLEDAAKVEIHGIQPERIFIEYSDARLAELGLSAAQLRNILQEQNIIISGGSVKVGPERLILEPSGNFETIEDLRKTVVALPGRGDVLFLEDIVEVSRGTQDPPRQITRVSGEHGLVLGVSLRDGGSILELGERVAQVVERMESRYPIGISMTRLADQPGRVEDKVDEFVSNLLQAIGLVLLVMLVTLGPRTGVLVAALIPTAILMTLALMKVVGAGLNQVTLAALIIALGMLIDNAIVVSESIIVQARQGKSLTAAAIDSARELRVPLLIASLTTASAFLPFRLAKAEAGEYTGVLFTVVTIALLSSWLLSLTMTPLLCVRLMKVPRRKRDEGDTRVHRAYRRLLLGLLRHRVASLAGIALLFALAMVGFRALPNMFFPKADRAFLMARLTLPAGSDISATDDVVRRFERQLEAMREDPDDPDDQGVTSWASFVGSGEPRFILNVNAKKQNSAQAFLLINVTSYEAVGPAIRKLRAFAARSFPDVVASIDRSDLGPPVEKPIQVRILGPDPDRLFEYVDAVKARLRQIPGARNIMDDWGQRTKKLMVEIDQPRARRAGVSSADVAISLQTLLDGLPTTEFRQAEETIPIVLRSVEADRNDIGKLESLNVFSQATGRSVPLLQVADVEVAWEPSKIFRRNRVRTATVSADIAPGLTPSEVDRPLYEWLERASQSWAPGYSFQRGGEIEESGKSQRAIAVQIPLAVGIIVLLLIGQFNSLRRGLIVMLTIPLGLIGVVGGLLLLGSYFGFMTLLGIVSLSGILINNAIVLVDRIDIERRDNGREPPQAIVEAAQRRLRPILMTTATTVLGLLPLYLGGGPMWEPMAIAIMFGLVFATVLTLGVVPILYSLLFRVSFRSL